jgi:hypothetical protein
LTHSLLLLICNTKLEHNNEALLFSFTHSSEKENKSVLVMNTYSIYTHWNNHILTKITETETQREREKMYPPSDLTCLLQTQSSSGFCKTSQKANGDWTQHTKHHFSQKQKQQKNVTQKKLLTKSKHTKTNTQNKTHKNLK